MAIIRSKKEYTTIPNEWVTAKIGDDAFRLIVYIESLADKSQVTLKDLRKDLKWEHSKINTCIQDLIKAGMIEVQNNGEKVNFLD